MPQSQKTVNHAQNHFHSTKGYDFICEIFSFSDFTKVKSYIGLGNDECAMTHLRLKLSLKDTCLVNTD